jgi:hypothetical protein
MIASSTGNRRSLITTQILYHYIASLDAVSLGFANLLYAAVICASTRSASSLNPSINLVDVEFKFCREFRVLERTRVPIAQLYFHGMRLAAHAWASTKSFAAYSHPCSANSRLGRGRFCY